MEKIDSREKLIHTASEAGYKTILYETEYSSSSLAEGGFNNYPYRTINPWAKEIFDKHEDFRDLPNEFFVDIAHVNNTYVDKVDDSVKHVIQNTCINQENYWVFREAFRFNTGVYKPIGFMRQLSSARVVKPELALHFPHASVEDPTMLAYTPSHEYGKRDRQVRIKVGKYLTRYYSNVLTPEQIRAFANGMKGFDIKWADDKGGFRYVYEHGPSSCMSGGVDEFSDLYGDYHPVDVYDTGEFRLAYLAGVSNSIVARGFVHEPDKQWVRVYGDEADALAESLNDLGYRKVDSWAGKKILRIYDDDDKPVLPYLDGSDKGVRGVGKFYEICARGHDYWCDFTNGTPEDNDDRMECGHCGDMVSEDDTYYSEYHDRHIGECCIDEYRRAVVGRRQVDWVHENDCVLCLSNDEWYVADNASDFDIVQTVNGDYYFAHDCVSDIDGDWVLESEAIKVGEDAYVDTYTARRYLVVQYDGSTPIALWDPDYMPEDIKTLYETDTKVTTDNGTQMGLRFRRVDELLLALGLEYAQRQLSKINYYPNNFSLTHVYARLTQIKEAA